jgi:hypothetical protein
METFRIPAGSTVYVGKPANPLSQSVEQGMSRGLSALDGITEAHLPMCYVQGVMPLAAQVLVIVVDPAADLGALMVKAGEVVRHNLEKGKQLDIWPLGPRDSMLTMVRNAGCKLFGKQPSKSFLSKLFRQQ